MPPIRPALLGLLVALPPLPAPAAQARCTATIQGQAVTLAYDPDDPAIAESLTLRERATATAGLGGDACPGLVVLRHLTPDLDDGERGAFCLVREDGDVTGFSQGERTAGLACAETRTVCERVNASAETAREIAGLEEDATLGETAGAAARGAAELRERAGATILSGPGGFLANTLGGAGSALAGVLTAPATLAAAAVTVVAVGGAVYICR